MSKSKQTAVVVIPTYNEVGTIGKMIDELCGRVFPKIKDWNCQLLVVDDTSPDGTYKVVQQKQKTYSNLQLFLNPTKAGIGGAYVQGFRYAISKLSAEVIIEFDGDFQHPPELIPVLLKEINHGYDYVVGSRKIPGGSSPSDWGFTRKFFTYFGGFVARFILFFPFKYFWIITDPTTGLKASRVHGFVDRLDMDHLYSKNFGYKLEFFFQMTQLGAKVKEIPLQFGLRQAGESKISGGTAKDILLTVIKLRWHDPFIQKFLKFSLVGGFGFFVNIIGAKVFKGALIKPESNLSLLNGISNALAAEVAIISNFIGNNLWTFSTEKITNFQQLISKFITFNLSSVITGIVIPSVIIGFLTSLFGDRLLIYQVIAIFGVTIPLNWIVYNTIIWQQKTSHK